MSAGGGAAKLSVWSRGRSGAGRTRRRRRTAPDPSGSTVPSRSRTPARRAPRLRSRSPASGSRRHRPTSPSAAARTAAAAPEAPTGHHRRRAVLAAFLGVAVFVAYDRGSLAAAWYGWVRRQIHGVVQR